MLLNIIRAANGEVNDNYWNVPGYHQATRSVEEYDHVSNSWSEFASMINPRCCHQSVAVGNKLFVIGGGTDTCEVYDSTCKKFVALKKPASVGKAFFQKPPSAVTIENNIIFFGVFTSNILCYDVKKKEWCQKSCEVADTFEYFNLEYLNVLLTNPGNWFVQVPRLEL